MLNRCRCASFGREGSFSTFLPYRSASNLLTWNRNSLNLCSAGLKTLHEREDLAIIRNKILETALSNVPQYSFHLRAIERAIQDLGYPRTLRGIFPNGTLDLIDHLFQKGLISIQGDYQQLIRDNHQKLGSGKIVMHLTRKRLEFMKPYIYFWPDAVKTLSHPSNIPFSLLSLHRLVDEIWFLAGDKSFDLNYYSKRGLLAGIYASTELYMTHDRSPEFQATWEFLQGRFQDSHSLGRTTESIKELLSWGKNNIEGVLKSQVHNR